MDLAATVRLVVVLLSPLLSAQTSPCRPRDCYDLLCFNMTNSPKATLWLSSVSGVSQLTVRCDFNTDGGGWTVFQRREDGSVNFEQPWQKYKTGFGNDREFWLGNEHVHRLTADRAMVLRVDMQRTNDQQQYGVYGQFRVRNERHNYSLTLGAFTVDLTFAGDTLGFHRDMPFSTYDQDNSPGKCATTLRSGWWYNNCVKAFLNGLWRGNVSATGVEDNRGMMWTPYDPKPHLRYCSMKFRPSATKCSVPCPNGGTCRHISDDHYRCDCASGYTGPTCMDAMPCYNTTCKNGGSATKDEDVCYCDCAKGYSGTSCELKAPSIGPAATPVSARNGAARRDEGFTSVGSSNGGVDVYMVAFICVGTVVMLLAAGFVWSLVNSMRLRKQAIASGVITEHLSAKEKKRQECKQTLHSIHEDFLDGQKPDQTEHPIKEGSLIGCDDQTSLAISV